MTRDQITTRLDNGICEIVEHYKSDTRDQIILIREAIHALRSSDLRNCKVHVSNKDWQLTIEASK